MNMYLLHNLTIHSHVLLYILYLLITLSFLYIGYKLGYEACDHCKKL